MSTTVKEELHRLIDQLPDDWTREQCLEHITNLREFYAGLQEAQSDETVSVKDYRQRLEKSQETSH